MSWRSGVISAIAAAAVLWAGEHGIRPRPTPDDYPAREAVKGFTLAAAVLTPQEVKKRFATDLNHGYVVVEVAVFLQPGHDVTMAAKDFMARYGSQPEIERPVSPETIAARLGKKDAPPPEAPSKVHVYTADTIGYEHGPMGPNGRSTGGVYTATSTGVGVGDTPYPPPAQPSSGGMDRTSIQTELDDLSLPEHDLSEDTAGYFYFPKPTKGKSSPLHLTYYGEQGKIELALPMK
ncbi:MAG TPA: hypothetical protein VME43_23570 [Bryobacteraceae bacterium]|nr:hypothetical protein [Bryobacteraceae bacterium]